MKKSLLLLGIAVLSLVSAAHATAAPPMIQFRLVVDNPTADSEQMTAVQPDNSPRQPDVLNVQKAVLLDSSDVKNATAGVNRLGQPIIDMKLTEDGAKRLAEVTRKNVGERLAIVIDGKLYSAPRINSAITGGEAQITGAFTKAEAENLAARLDGSNGSPSGQVRPGNKTVFYALAAMVVIALVTAAWIALRQRRAPPAA